MAQQSLVNAAKAPIIAYNKKNWDAVRAAVTPGFVYDEVATQRKVQGINDVLAEFSASSTCERALPDFLMLDAHPSFNYIARVVYTWLKWTEKGR